MDLDPDPAPAPNPAPNQCMYLDPQHWLINT